jgi:hypothetical protein
MSQVHGVPLLVSGGRILRMLKRYGGFGFRIILTYAITRMQMQRF